MLMSQFSGPHIDKAMSWWVGASKLFDAIGWMVFDTIDNCFDDKHIQM